MAVLIDTSAFYALLDERDPYHDAAVRAAARIGRDQERLVAHSHLIAEAIALVQARFGVAAVRRLATVWFPLVDVLWVGKDLHERALGALLAADRRNVSLVDHTSFVLMRDLGIGTAFAFDGDFAAQGFELVRA